MKKLLFLLLLPIGTFAQLADSLSSNLNEVIISGAMPPMVLRSGTENIVDYSFADTNILISSYSGFNGNKAKLFLLSPYGDTLSVLRTSQYPVGLFHSCQGKNYFVSNDYFYQVGSDSSGLQLGQAIDKRLFKGFAECQTCIGDRLFYKSVDKPMFKVTLNTGLKNDTVLSNIYSISSPSTAEASFEEMGEIIFILEHSNDFNAASKILGRRTLLNNRMLAFMNFSVFRQHDQLAVFDFFDAHIHRFDSAANAIGTTPIGFRYKEQRCQLVQDAAYEKVYLLNETNAHATLQEIDIATGLLTGSCRAIQLPFATRIKVNNGYVYYLWQNQDNHSVNQLYRQSLL